MLATKKNPETNKGRGRRGRCEQGRWESRPGARRARVDTPGGKEEESVGNDAKIPSGKGGSVLVLPRDWEELAARNGGVRVNEI